MNDAQRSSLAGQYRQQLYDNPESLADVVSVAPVRSGDRVTGYRIAPAKIGRLLTPLDSSREISSPR